MSCISTISNLNITFTSKNSLFPGWSTAVVKDEANKRES